MAKRCVLCKVPQGPLRAQGKLFWEGQHLQPPLAQRMQVHPHPDPDTISKGWGYEAGYAARTVSYKVPYPVVHGPKETEKEGERERW